MKRLLARAASFAGLLVLAFAVGVMLVVALVAVRVVLEIAR